MVGAIIIGYFLPTIIALLRSKKNKGSIIVVNVFLGWSIIGWVVALAWACGSDDKHTVHIAKESTSEELERLVRLKEKNVITEEEFKTQKEKILGK